jgi:hypothetical protein
MDMPVMIVHVEESVKAWDLSSSFGDMSRMLSTLREVWDRQTVADLEQGNIAVPDDVLNQYLQQAVGDSNKVREFNLTSLDGNKIKVHLRTDSVGVIEMICQIKQFEHDKDHSVMKLYIEDKTLPDRPLMSFIFSHMSMAMVTKLAGQIDVGSDLALDFRGNMVTVDFHQALSRSKLAGIEVMGYRPLDELVVKGATTRAGVVEFQTNLALPKNVVDILMNVL